ncbi:MAG: MBL fold metallo-hydrolase [Clostridiales bacterium]|nr:MBL fold metallo-hydrolase [Clostridiales bacterium]
MVQLDIRMVTGGPLDVNTYVVGPEGGAGCVVIDPGAEPEKVRAAVGDRHVEAVLLTHGHFDHMLFAQHWLSLGAKLYVHALDAQALRSPSLNLSRVVNTQLVLPAADVLLQEGDIVREAGLELIVLHTPGHTPGGVCYQSGKTLFSGDTLFYGSYGRLDLPGGDAGDMIASLTRLMQLDADTIAYPGHGMKTKIAWERGNYA